jgi:hypothetical protein
MPLELRRWLGTAKWHWITGSKPDPALAISAVANFAKISSLQATRYRSGHQHYVFEVQSEKEKWVVKFASKNNRHLLQSAVEWTSKLKHCEIFLPEILFVNLRAKIPYLISQHREGENLLEAFANLSSDERTRLAKQVAGIHQQAERLPRQNGFGWTGSSGTPRHSTWAQALEERLTKIRGRINFSKAFEPVWIDRVSQFAKSFESQWARVLPNPFLDDLTLNNVLVEKGYLSSIIDVDSLCYGDRRLMLGTLIAECRLNNFSLDYARQVVDLLTQSSWADPTLRFYEALSYLEQWSGQGQLFNGNNSQWSHEKTSHLRQLLNGALSSQ